MTPRRAARTTKAWLVPVLLAFVAVVLVVGRFLMSAHVAIGAAESAWARGDRVEATRSYLDALRCYVPGSPFESRALDGLQALAGAAVDARDSDGERRALEAIRAGLLGTRSIFAPGQFHLARAERRLAELDAAAVFPPTARPVAIASPRRHGWEPRAGHGHLAVFSTPLALVGFAAWVSAVVLFIRRSLRSDGDVSAAPLRVSGALTRALAPVLFVVGFGLFLVGLRLA